MRRFRFSSSWFLWIAAAGALTPGLAAGGVMQLMGIRWNQETQVQVDVGHEEVQNLTKQEVLEMFRLQFASWTNLLEAGSLHFNFSDASDTIYDENYPFNAAWWGQPSPGRCALGGVARFPAPYTLNRRYDHILIQVTTRLDPSNLCEDPDWYGEYCWYDCRFDPQSGCDALHTYDARSVLTHEAGHAAIGLGHYTPCNWSQSVMYEGAEAGCAQHWVLGTADESTAGWSLRSINSDLNEPANDYLTGAVFMESGELYDPPYNQLGVDGSVPGHADLDAWKLNVTGMPLNDGYAINFLLICQDPAIRLRMVVYKGFQQIQDLQAALDGDDVQWHEEAENGEYRVFVTTADGVGDGNSNQYTLVAQLYHPVMAAPEVAPAVSSLQVIHPLQLVRGSGTGLLEVFDAGGQELLALPVQGDDWSMSLLDRRLPTGVYFLRLRRPSGSAGAKLVVIR
jgi:hypothetical protein